jgi:glycosyltransferase involved in cell wall biosynthesis
VRAFATCPQCYSVAGGRVADRVQALEPFSQTKRDEKQFKTNKNRESVKTKKDTEAMRIGIDIRCLMEGKQTGVEEYTLQLLENIFIQDRENQYLLFFNAHKDPKNMDLEWVKKYPNVSVKRFRWPNKLLNFCLWYFRWPKLDLLLGGVDIFFMPNLNFAAFSSKAKVYVTAHDLSFERYPETFSWKRRLWHSFVNFRALCRRADHIIAVSASTKQDLLEMYRISKQKVSVIPSGISNRFHVMNRNNPLLLKVKERYHLPYRFILYLGTLEPRKNVEAVVQAFGQLQRSGHVELQKYSLVIAGGKGWKYDQIFREVERSEFRDKILVTGFVEDEDKPALYNLSSLFVYPSFFEGFGFPPLEAAACGVPVVTSNTSAFPEVIDEAGILVDPYQPQEVYQAMREILISKDLRENLSKKGLARSKEFNWHRAAQSVLRLWRSS